MADLFVKYIELAIKCGVAESEREKWSLQKIHEEEQRNERASRRDLERQRLSLEEADRQAKCELEKQNFELEKQKFELEKERLRLEESDKQRCHEKKWLRSVTVMKVEVLVIKPPILNG